ncbi:hypothetical protein TUSST3_76880 [Streptomyces sp. TUS-ST3]|uniref:hypothetical protein n=1 Tax=Streptomyces sp. TUS-ST3 TaxID=3025591 RepID=UPI00235B591C|nr:hypothetical protein [Streptomyces sp. TUS-ST3]GLP71068.1 hypothetical protein TUSST3_76880 [Streptomyces sp. TUS-ST3]
MTTMKTARLAFTRAARLSQSLAALRDLYGVQPQLTITPDVVLVVIPWTVGRADFREALAGDIALLLGTELAVTGSTDEDDPWIGLVADGEMDGVRVHVELVFPPAPAEQGA